YALGVLLHELLTGLLPVDVRAVAAAGFAALPTLWQGPPPRPMSTVVAAAADAAALAAARATSARRLAAALRGDLDVVVGAAIERDRLRRYPSVRDFARDVARVLAREPIEARPPSPLRRARLFVQRHATAAAVTATALAAGALLLAQTVGLARERARLAEAALLANDPLTVAGLLESRRALRGDREGAAAIDAWLAQAQPILDRAALHRARAAAGATQAAAFVGKALPELEAAVARAVAWRADLQWLAAFEVEHAALWATVRAEVLAEPRYGGLDLRPQFGLLPLGCDPVSKLQEFQLVNPSRRALPASARCIRREVDGTLAMATDMDPVLVLLPGGEFTMGTPKGVGPDNEGVDETFDVVELERPTQPGTKVAACFVGKFEVTSAQYEAVTGEAPAFWDVDTFRAAQEEVRQRQEQGLESGTDGNKRALELAASHGMPVDSVTWEEATAMAARLGARLPTEAEWEYAARGGTTTACSCAATERELRSHANLIDCTEDVMVQGLVKEPRIDFTASDGVGPPAPVGCFARNPFGLYDVHGNVQEWCAGAPHAYGKSISSDPKSRLVRGGSYQSALQVSRSAARQEARAGAAARDLGLRLARDVMPAAVR
ncbi:MAG: SUMF1/EgtB/PvdO family nonheme iron enzyme, partial [Planctomycetota bacterium]